MYDPELLSGDIIVYVLICWYIYSTYIVLLHCTHPPTLIGFPQYPYIEYGCMSWVNPHLRGVVMKYADNGAHGALLQVHTHLGGV